MMLLLYLVFCRLLLALETVLEVCCLSAYGRTNQCAFLSRLLSKEMKFSQLTDSYFVT